MGILEYFQGPAIHLATDHSIMRRASAASQLPASRIAVGQKLVLLSWNILCPSYKRKGGGKRESDTLEWQARAREQIDYVRDVDADIVGLQEFWTSNPMFVRMWNDFADEQGYHMFLSPRTNGKADGLCLLVRNEFELEMGCLVGAVRDPSSPPQWPGDAAAFSAWSFNDWGDRVVQLLRLPVGECGSISLLNGIISFSDV